MTTQTRGLSAERETLILDAAQRRFAGYGLNKVTMDEIAGDVGMGKASLYYYFATKEELFRGVIRREQQVILSRLHEILSLDVSAGEKLRRYVQLRHKYFAVLVNLHLLNLHAWVSSRPLFRDLFESFAAEELKFLSEILRSGKKSGEFDVRSPEATATLFLHVMQGLRLRAARDVQQINLPDAVSQQVEHEMRQMVEIFVQGLNRAK